LENKEKSLVGKKGGGVIEVQYTRDIEEKGVLPWR
jgi:hypothetical protein